MRLMGTYKLESELDKILNKNRLINSENNLQRLPIRMELELMEKIKLGKYHEIKVLNYDELGIHIGKITANEFKKYEYTTVALITCGTRAAIEGGLFPDEAYDISDAMLSRLEKASTVEEMHDIVECAAIILAREVLKCKQCKNSYVLYQCKTYINRNICQRIYLKDLAAYVGMNPSYLSHYFSEKEGISLQHYIQKIKIERACKLLKYSDRTVSTIAQDMGFSSQSNFTDVFKRIMLISPLEFRNQNLSTTK